MRCHVRTGAVALAVLLTGSPPAQAGELRTDEELVVAADEVIEDDLYAFGGRIVVDGTVRGDLIAFGNVVIVNGAVDGDVLAAGQTIVIAGQVGDDVRIAGQVLQLARGAKVGGDVVAAAMGLECQAESEIGADLIYGGYQLLLGGAVGRNVLAGCGALELQGKVSGDMKIDVGPSGGGGTPPTYGAPPAVVMPVVAPGLTVGPSAEVGGSLRYRSTTEGRIDPEAQIAGGVEYEKSEAPGAQPTTPVEHLVSGVRRYMALLVIGTLLLFLMPRWTATLGERVREQPGPCLGFGALALVAVLVLFCAIVIATFLALVLLGVITLGDLILPVLLVGLTGEAAAVSGFIVHVAYVAPVVVALVVGRSIVRKDAPWLPLLVGLLVVVVVTRLPFVGELAGFVIALLGLGALWLWGRDALRARSPESAGPGSAASESAAPA